MGGWEHEGLQLLLTDPVLHRHPPKSLCMNLQGLTGSGSSPTWARLWLVGYLHPISLLLWGRRCGGVPLQPVGYSTVSAAFSHGCRGDAWGAQTSCPKAPSFGGDGPLGSPFLPCRCLPLPTFVSAVPCSQGINSDCGWNQVSDVMRTGCLPWGCGQVGSCPQLFFAPFPAGLCLGVAVSVRRR